MTRRGRRTDDDTGAATVLAVALLGLLVLLGLALSVVGAIFTAHRTAQAAADLAALAGASVLAQPGAGGGDPCAEAGSTATANGATLVACVVEGREVRVSVEVAGPRWRGLVTADLVAEARAGPDAALDPGGAFAT